MKDFQNFVKVWFEFYEMKTGTKYYMSKKEGANLKKLINIFEEVEAFKAFLYSIQDQWTLNKLSISIVLMNVNVLRQQQARIGS